MLCMIGNIINLREKFYEIKFWNLVYVMKKKILKLVCMLINNKRYVDRVSKIWYLKLKFFICIYKICSIYLC